MAPSTHRESIRAAPPPGYDLTMPEREPVTVEIDVEVAAMLREHAAAEQVSEGETVERALR